MKRSLFYFTFLTIVLTTYSLIFQAHAAPPAAPVIKHLSSLLKWTTARSSAKNPQSDEDFLQFEDGYLVETVVEGNELGVIPYSIRVSQDGELFAVDETNSNIVKITPPLSHYSRARLVAGSFQGYAGHVDGKANDARFNHPRGVTMDDKGNVYVADTANLAIRKIGDAGVTTIAGGKSNVAGYRDGPSEDAKFSADFDVIYLRPTCSLLVIDRGNAALRQISLNQDDCDQQYSSVSVEDIVLVVGAVIIGYTICMIQQGFGQSLLSRMQQPKVSKSQEQVGKEKATPIVETIKEEPEAGWPSFGQLLVDLSKLAVEAFAGGVLQFTPFNFWRTRSPNNLTPLKDTLIMPEDAAEPPLVQKHRAPAPQSEIRQTHTQIGGDKYSEMKPPKLRSSSFKDPSLSTKHRSSKRQDYAEFYGPNDVPAPHVRSKSMKDRTKHRHRDKSGEVGYGVAGVEHKPPADMKPVNHDEPKFGHYSSRNKYGDSYQF